MIRNVPHLIDDAHQMMRDVDEIDDIIDDWYWRWHDLDDISDEIDDIIGWLILMMTLIWMIFGWNLGEIWMKLMI